MDNQRFDAITKLAASAPDRRSALKLAGAAALLGATGFVARPDGASALVTVVITNLLTGIEIPITVQNNNIAVQVCAAVELLNTELFSVDTLNCEVGQRTGGGGGGGQEARKGNR